MSTPLAYTAAGPPVKAPALTDAERAEMDAEEKRVVADRECMDDPPPAPSEPLDAGDAGTVAGDAPVVDLVGILRTEVYTGPRYPTRIAPLDELLGGGLAPGFTFGVSGEPGGGKTLLVAQVAAELFLQGATVCILAGDEDRSGIAQRIGQYLGFEHDDLDGTHPETLGELEANLGGRTIRIFPDPNRPPVTVEDVEKELLGLRAKEPTAPLVFVVDSLQTVTCKAGQADDAETTGVVKIVDALKGIKKRLNAIVLATSEAPRSSYASKDPSQRTRGIASFAGSRTPEYRFDIVANIVPFGEVSQDRARLVILKNRLGHRKGIVPLALDRSRARWLALDPGVVEAEQAEKKEQGQNEEQATKVSAHRAQVKKILRDAKVRPVSFVAFKAAWRGAERDLVTTLDVMEEEGAIIPALTEKKKSGGVRGRAYDFAKPKALVFVSPFGFPKAEVEPAPVAEPEPPPPPPVETAAERFARKVATATARADEKAAVAAAVKAAKSEAKAKAPKVTQ